MSAATATEVAPATKPVLPEPLCKFFQHPGRWLENKLVMVLFAAILAYIGMLAASGTYYLLFEVNSTMTALWHHAVPDPNLRHNIRNIGEGLFGGLFAQFAVWSHYKKRKATLTKVDKLMIRLHIANVKDERPLSVWQLLATPFLVLLFAAPGFLFAFFVLVPIVHSMFHGVGVIYGLFEPTVATSVNPKTMSLMDKFTSLFTKNIDKKLLGYGASLFWGRLPTKGVFDDLQLWVVDQFIRYNKKPLRWFPAPFRARYNQQLLKAERLSEVGKQPPKHGSHWMRVGLMAGVVIAVVLAAFGFYVLMFVAQ